MFQNILNHLYYIKEYLFAIEPNNTYLTFAGSFGITVLAIAIPLSIDAIGRLSNRYQSNIITKLFNKEQINIRLKITSFTLVLLILVISFFSPDGVAFVKRKMYHPTNRIVYHLV
ncbi:hypothetical protein [Halanaerobium congolense]|uniref:hypothetical protein n=1 Tax=Halanaerobium congolense TaxID=54121 RepID=UPI001AAD123B|nr:hypothetical protein [Halanaerobium congolense]